MKETGGNLGRDGVGLDRVFGGKPLSATSVVDWIVHSPMVLEHTLSTYIDVVVPYIHTTCREHEHITKHDCKIGDRSPFSHKIKSGSYPEDDGLMNWF